jgi:hypothetical protein
MNVHRGAAHVEPALHANRRTGPGRSEDRPSSHRDRLTTLFAQSQSEGAGPRHRVADAPDGRTAMQQVVHRYMAGERA